MIIELPKIKCKRCGYLWIPKKTRIRCCARCKSPYFDMERNEDELGRKPYKDWEVENVKA